MTRGTVAALMCAGLLVTAGCGGSSSPATTSPEASPSTSSASASETPSAATSSAESDTVEVAVSVKDGKVSPKTHREKIAKGSKVALVITIDVDDEAHVHGYEIEKELPAGQATTIAFTADQTGLFEVETHEGGLQMLQLEVK